MWGISVQIQIWVLFLTASIEMNFSLDSNHVDRIALHLMNDIKLKWSTFCTTKSSNLKTLITKNFIFFKALIWVLAGLEMYRNTEYAYNNPYAVCVCINIFKIYFAS